MVRRISQPNHAVVLHSEFRESITVSVPERSLPVSTESNNSVRLMRPLLAVVFAVVLGIAVIVGVGPAVSAQDAPPVPDRMIIENPQAVYVPNERVDLLYAGCAPRAVTRLELRTTPVGGLVLAEYPSPPVNLAGTMRASVLLPSVLPRGEAVFSLTCASESGPLVQAVAPVRLDVATVLLDVAPTGTPVSVYSPVLLPGAPGSVVTEDLAITGVGAVPVAAGAGAALFLTAGMLWLTRRRGGPRWSPAGMPLNGPR